MCRQKPIFCPCGLFSQKGLSSAGGPKLLKWGLSGQGSNLLKSGRPLTPRTPGWARASARAWATRWRRRRRRGRRRGQRGHRWNAHCAQSEHLTKVHLVDHGVFSCPHLSFQHEGVGVGCNGLGGGGTGGGADSDGGGWTHCDQSVHLVHSAHPFDHRLSSLEHHFGHEE